MNECVCFPCQIIFIFEEAILSLQLVNGMKTSVCCDARGIIQPPPLFLFLSLFFSFFFFLFYGFIS